MQHVFGITNTMVLVTPTADYLVEQGVFYWYTILFLDPEIYNDFGLTASEYWTIVKRIIRREPKAYILL